MSIVPQNPGAGLGLQSPLDRPDQVPLKKGEYSVASRALALSTYFLSGALAINLSQFIGSPLYLVNQDWYNAWIAFTKQSFGLLTMTLTQAFAPTKVIVSGDASVRGQLRKTSDDNLILDFPSRLILIANHQIYTDWLYLWWIAYCNGMHGRLYIILKESLKRIPVLGWGMQMSQFIFLKRNWEKDRPHMASALQKLNKATEPMWLLLFPEGTNLAPSTREKSKAWAQKSGVSDMWHVLLPRSTGLQFCIEELKGTVDYLYDCTVAYEGVPRGQFAQDIFTLKAGYLEGRPPKSVSMHWRRFAIKDIPVSNQKTFELWLTARWREKDLLIENYLRNGKFPADTGVTKMKSGELKRGSGYLEVQIRSSHWYEFLQIFAPMGVLAMVLAVFYGAIPQRLWNTFNKQALKSSTEDIKKASLQAGSQVKAVSKSTAGLTLDDLFDKDKQGDSFKKGAIAVQQFLRTPQAETLMNRVDFVSSFLQNPQKAVTQTVTGQRKNFLKAIEEEETRRRQLKLPSSSQNVGSQKGKFWKDLQRLEQSRNGSVISAPSSTTSSKRIKPAGTFWADLEAVEQRKIGSRKPGSGLDYAAKGSFWDHMKAEENARHGTVRTLSSDASTAVGSASTITSATAGKKKLPSIASTLERKPSGTAKPASKLAKLPQTKAPANNATKPPATTKTGTPAVTASKATSASKLPAKTTAPPKAPPAVKKPTALPANTKPKPVVKSASSAVAKPSPTLKPPTKPQQSPATPKATAKKPTTAQSKPQAQSVTKPTPLKKQPPKIDATKANGTKPKG